MRFVTMSFSDQRWWEVVASLRHSGHVEFAEQVAARLLADERDKAGTR